jgi:hypothetical protein
MNSDSLKLIRYLSFKMDCLREQEANPLTLDVETCENYLSQLEQMKGEKVEALKKAMPRNPITKKKEKPKVMHKKDGSLSSHGERWFELLRELKLPETTAGPVTFIDSYEDGNPNSSDQVKSWLFSLGWKPRTWKYVRDKVTGDERRIEQVRKDGHLCDSVRVLLSKDPAIELLDGLTVISHRIGVLKGFLNARSGNKVVAGAGGFTNTLRLQHRAPVVNLPGIEAVYGDWCRGVLVSPDDNHVLCGADVSSLEDMTKRHYIKPLDPQFVEDMSGEGYDAHLDLALYAGAVTQEDIDKHNSGEINLKPLRSKFKAANYSCVYGVGAAKLARETGMREREAKQLIEAYWDRNWSVKQVAKNQYVKTLKDGSMWLKNATSGFYHNLRYDKDRWSTTNQSTGVYVFDMWVMFCRKMGLTINMQYHDEILFVVKKGDEQQTSEILHKAMQKVNEHLKLNVTIEIEEQYGQSYASVH